MEHRTDATGTLGRSERISLLTAAFIRAAVRLRFGYEMSASESVELARVHDLRSAIDSIGAKMELHRNLPTRSRMELSIVESAIDPPVDRATTDSFGNVVSVRVKTLQTLSAETASVQDVGARRSALRALRTESRLWARDYGRFFEAMAKLYRNSRSKLIDMDLSGEDKMKAFAELEDIIVDGISRAGQI